METAINIVQPLQLIYSSSAVVSSIPVLKDNIQASNYETRHHAERYLSFHYSPNLDISIWPQVLRTVHGKENSKKCLLLKQSRSLANDDGRVGASTEDGDESKRTLGGMVG